MKKIIFIVFVLATVYAQSNSIPVAPDWAKSVVWYQIFPERFCNGDVSNDPKAVDIAGGWPNFVPDNWKTKEWTSDWYEQKDWELKTGFDFYSNAGLRRYGGDIQGIINKLDYLKELGISAIYLNPVFESPSLHKYDAASYHHIDNNFGPDPEGDRKLWESEKPADPSTWKWTAADKLFLKLIKECHKRNMKIIIDGVFNHVGNTFWAFKDVIKNQAASKYADWFYIDKFDNPATTENEFQYTGWFGVKDLPELKEDQSGLIKPIREHIFAVVKRWMDPDNDGNPQDGIDGWRLDVADMVNINFWEDFRKVVKGINKEAYITGEVWWKDWNNDVMFNAAPWLNGKAFDAVMNYRFARAIKNYVADKKDKINAKVFADSLANIYRDYPQNNDVMMNLLCSHDVERFTSIIVNPDFWYDHRGNPAQTKEWNPRKPDEKELMKMKLAVALQMTLPGAPMVYYGEETAMWGGDDPDCRKPMVWKEFKYSDEKAHPFNLPKQTDKVEFNKNVFDWYKKMIGIRNSNPAINTGEIRIISTEQPSNTMIFSRIKDGKEIVILVNNSDMPVLLENPKEKQATDLVTGKKYKDKQKISLHAYSVSILK